MLQRLFSGNLKYENMKHLLIVICLISFSKISFSQARVGSSFSEIKSEYYESNWNLRSGYNKDEEKYIYISTTRAEVGYYFESGQICYTTYILPKRQGDLNFYVEKYNKQYVIMSPTKWKMYSENGICNIELIYPEDGKCFFVWTKEE